MGTLTYNGSRVHFDDRVLAHLHIVIIQQFRRNQSFAMSWRDDVAVGNGRSSIWLHPGCELSFKFAGSRLPAISQKWLAQLSASAESATGLIVTNEDGSLAYSVGSNQPY
nr:ATP-dependent DNA ligase [Herbiconiux sp. SYSU D00978]